MWHFESIPLFGFMSICLGSKYLGHSDEVLIIIYEALGFVDKPIVYQLGRKGYISIFLCGLNILPRILSRIPENTEFQITTWQFPGADNLVKFPHLSSILIPRVEYVDDVSVVHKLLIVIYLFYH